MIELKVHGDLETKRALETMKNGVQKRVAKKALRPAAAMVSKALKKGVPQIDDFTAWELTGLAALEGDALRESLSQVLEKNKDVSRAMQRLVKMSIGRKKKFYGNTGTALEAVGPKYNYRQPGIPISGGYIAQVLELGDDERPAQPFLRRAFAGVAQQAAEEMSYRAAELVREEARAARRASRG